MATEITIVVRKSSFEQYSSSVYTAIMNTETGTERGGGDSKAEALGKLILANPDRFGLSITDLVWTPELAKSDPRI